MANLTPEIYLSDYYTKIESKIEYLPLRYVKGRSSKSNSQSGTDDIIFYLQLKPKKLFRPAEIFVQPFKLVFDNDQNIKAIDTADILGQDFTQYIKTRLGDGWEENIKTNTALQLEVIKVITDRYSINIIQDPWNPKLIITSVPPDTGTLESIVWEDPIELISPTVETPQSKQQSRVRGDYTIQVSSDNKLIIIGPNGNLVLFPDGTRRDIGTLEVVKKEDMNTPEISEIFGAEYEIPEEEQIDQEYTDLPFAGNEEVPLEIPKEEFDMIKLMDKADSPTSTFKDTQDAIQPETKVEKIGKFTRKIPKLVSGDSWQTRAANYISLKEGFTSKATWDANHFRMGYGTDHIVKNGTLTEVKKGDTCTKEEAVNTLANYGIDQFSGQIRKDLGESNWKKLTGNQKAALTSLGYNVGQYYISCRGYGNRIREAISNEKFDLAALEIYNGPRTSNGIVYSALVRRRKEEAQLFLLPDSVSIYDNV